MEEKLSGVLPAIGLLSRVMDLVVSAEVQLTELYSWEASSFFFYSLKLVMLGSGLLAQS